VGHHYGTIIVDLERRRRIEVLGGRDATIVADWLQERPSVTHVARDRAGAYSEAVETANPDAQQVADRWHLLTNLGEAVERDRHLRLTGVSLRDCPQCEHGQMVCIESFLPGAQPRGPPRSAP
jgi:transposase